MAQKDSANNLISGYSYALHATGRRTQITQSNGRVSDYTYDDLYRLTDEQITDAANGNYSANYQYDKVGNRTYAIIDGVHTSYTFDDNDRLIAAGGSTYTYDDNGNLLTETLDGVTTTYAYNNQNELTSVTKAGVTTEYSYNADGIRESKTEGGITTRYLIDQNRDYAQVLLEDNGTNEVVYTYGLDLISQERAGNSFFYHYDGLGSVRGLSNSGGVVTDTYDYDAFGELQNKTGSTENNYLFTGEQYDPSLDQYYLRARNLDTSIDRFTQMDVYQGAIFNPVSLNKYLYANADPVNGIDPSGYITLMDLTKAIEQIGVHSARASYHFGKKQVGRGFGSLKNMGRTAEKMVDRIVQECIKPKASDFKRGEVLVKGNKRKLDFELYDEAADVFHHLEVKSKLPASGSEALRRLKNQLLDAQAANKTNVKVIGGDVVSEAHLKKTINYLSKSGVDVSAVQFFNSFVEFARWGAEMYAEECFDGY